MGNRPSKILGESALIGVGLLWYIVCVICAAGWFGTTEDKKRLVAWESFLIWLFTGTGAWVGYRFYFS
jgi:hypothetical protein